MKIGIAGSWILGELEDGEQIPSASSYSKAATESNCMVNMLLLDIDAYEEKYGEKAVRKNLTIFYNRRLTWKIILMNHFKLNLSKITTLIDHIFTFIMDY